MNCVSIACLSAPFSVLLYFRYVEVMRSLMSDNCRYLIEAFYYDKDACGGSSFVICPEELNLVTFKRAVC